MKNYYLNELLDIHHQQIRILETKKELIDVIYKLLKQNHKRGSIFYLNDEQVEICNFQRNRSLLHE